MPVQKPSRQYDSNFVVTKEYRESMPDMQESSEIRGAPVPIIQVGSSNFKMPLRFITPNKETLTLEATISSTVRLDDDSKGINMSRIIRTIYDFENATFSPELLSEILIELKKRLNSSEAWLKISFSYPILQKSLRSGLEGYQYYSCAYEGISTRSIPFRKIIHLDYVYSSACPCSSELSEHAREERNVYGIPHSQRSTARIKVEVDPQSKLTLEELKDLCKKGIPTETQVMVKREDEQAFAELNGANTIFVEDAIRSLYQVLTEDARIIDFEAACAHLESLHSHDAVAVINKGIPNGFKGDFRDFSSLIR